VFDDVVDCAVVFQYFLMVAPALIGRASLNQKGHLQKYFLGFA
jgi:hypothetical protein